MTNLNIYQLTNNSFDILALKKGTVKSFALEHSVRPALSDGSTERSLARTRLAQRSFPINRKKFCS